MDQCLPLLPADLTFVRVNGGRTYANLLDWDDQDAPTAGQHVLVADGGSERFEAVIVDLRADGVMTLTIPEFAAASPGVSRRP